MTDLLADGDPETRLRAIGAEIAGRVEAAVPRYLQARVGTLIEAWGRLDDTAALELRGAIDDAGPGIAATTAAHLRELFALPAADQSRTPLEVLVGIVTVPTGLLEAAGIPPVVRDETDERMRPDDRYDLAPRALAELGDPELGPLQLAWGLTKHRALRPDP